MIRTVRKGRMSLSRHARKGRVTLDKIVGYRPPKPWLNRARRIENELLDTPVEAWSFMGGDVVRRERGPWPQRILIILAALIFLAGFTLANFMAVHAGVSHVTPKVLPIYYEPIPKPIYAPGFYDYAGRPNPYGSAYPASVHTLDDAAAYLQRIWANNRWGTLSLEDARAIVSGTKSPAHPDPLPFLGWPLAGGVGRFTGYFSTSHPAVDIAAPCGTHLLASLPGVVVWEGWKDDGGGIVVDIVYGVAVPRDGYPGNGWFISYNHLSASVVNKGQTVVRGQYIGRVGMTGWATGCHTHYMVAHNYVWVNPLPLLR